MAYNYEYPYVDPNRANTDWEIKTVIEVKNDMETFKQTISDSIESIVENIITTLLWRATYDADDESVTFLTETGADTEIVIEYDPDTQLIRVRRALNNG